MPALIPLTLPLAIASTPLAVSAPLDDGRPESVPQSRAENRNTIPLARVRRGESVLLREKPGGRPVARARAKTEFGSKRVMPLLRRRGRWAAVPAAERGNRLAWLDSRSGAIDTRRTSTWLRADLSRRTLELHRGERTVKRMKVSVGRPGSPTPVGSFAVTDKLDGRRFSTAYGCCILALSGRQRRPPAGWPGGDRLAIHGAPSGARVGRAASAGCLQGRSADLRLLMRRVPVGAPVRIVR